MDISIPTILAALLPVLATMLLGALMLSAAVVIGGSHKTARPRAIPPREAPKDPRLP